MRSLKQIVEYHQFGVADGHPVIYFHGTPGSAEECQVFDHYGKENNLAIICYDRSTIDPQLEGVAYYQRIADEITDKVAGKPVDFVGFSMGAFIALQICQAMNGKVRSLHLISAAAPLDADNFIDLMAGKAVFRLAQNNPFTFLLLAHLQGCLARIFPGLLFRMLFSSAAGEDKTLVADKAFRATISRGLKTCFNHPQAYARDIKAYVQPWKESLPDITVSTTIWHGAEDNWSPVSMAVYLASALPNCAKMEILDGLSHYSCLYRVSQTICLTINTLRD
ncbi:MAG: alpha/beta hydrolase [Methylovulum sp.]|nr:alpha/beta hydrolase [Methylovulum sp.]